MASSTLCTLVVAGDGLILIDTGLGTRDFVSPSIKMRVFTALMRSPRDGGCTARRQVEALGFRPENVEHIVVTHLHLDHSGGLPDFPDALVHVTRAEYETAMRPLGVRRLFYEQAHWQHGPRWRIHEAVDPGSWFGFDAITIPEIRSARVLMVPLVGHSPGHVGVAVLSPSQEANGAERTWIFHCGDALPFGGLASPAPDSISRAVCGPHIGPIRRLAGQHTGEIEVLSSHVPPLEGRGSEPPSRNRPDA